MSDYYKPGKRMVFRRKLNQQEEHDEQLKQINQKQVIKENAKSLDRGEDKKYLQAFLDSMRHQEHNKKTLFHRFTKEFKDYNDNKIMNNLTWTQNEREAKKRESYNFFPFTHGDKIEEDRARQKEIATEELRDKLRRGVRVTARNKLSQSFYKENSPLCSLDSSRGDDNQFRRIKDMASLESVTGRVPVRYTTAYPAFMKPSKHYPYRRLNDTHVEKVMQQAIKRVEDTIKSNEKQAENG